MRELSKMMDAYSKASVGFERIREVVDARGEVRDIKGAKALTRIKGAIEFKDVTFGYNSDERPGLKNVASKIIRDRLWASSDRAGPVKQPSSVSFLASTVRLPAQSR